MYESQQLCCFHLGTGEHICVYLYALKPVPYIWVKTPPVPIKQLGSGLCLSSVVQVSQQPHSDVFGSGAMCACLIQAQLFYRTSWGGVCRFSSVSHISRICFCSQDLACQTLLIWTSQQPVPGCCLREWQGFVNKGNNWMISSHFSTLLNNLITVNYIQYF